MLSEIFKYFVDISCTLKSPHTTGSTPVHIVKIHLIQMYLKSLQVKSYLQWIHWILLECIENLFRIAVSTESLISISASVSEPCRKHSGELHENTANWLNWIHILNFHFSFLPQALFCVGGARECVCCGRCLLNDLLVECHVHAMRIIIIVFAIISACLCHCDGLVSFRIIYHFR